MAIHKPAGMTVYEESPATPNAQALLEAQLHTKLWPVHRLDRTTCGVLVFAKSGRAASEIRKLLASRQVEKTYRAIVPGETPPQGRIQVPLTHKGETMSAQTDFKTLVARGGFSLVEVRPRTGRHHQIRKHLKAIGHPIVGDVQYGGPAAGPAGLADRPLLSAVALKFPHPRTRKPVSLMTHPDADFGRAVRKFQ